MPDLMTALRNAHNAGDEEAARRIAAMIREQEMSSPASIAPAVPQERSSFMDEVIGGAEGALALGTGMIAEPLAGLAGIAEAANPWAQEGASADMVEKVRNMLTYQPKTREGGQAIAGVGEALDPLVRKLQYLKEHLGDDAFEATGSPELAAMVSTLPEATLELLGAGGGRRAALTAAQDEPVRQAQRAAQRALKESEDLTGIRQVTSDVLPPQSRTGKFFQARGEEVSPGLRAEQQVARTEAVQNLLDRFDVDEAARFESKVVEGVKNSINKSKAAAGEMYEQTAGRLNEMGDVPISQTKGLADKVLQQELRKGTLSDQGLVRQMQDFLDAPDTMNFEDVKSIRSSVGRDLAQAKRGAPVTGTSDVSLLSQIYKKLSNDMRKFAKDASPELAKEWRKADKIYSDFATGADKTGVKGLIKKGDSTPEVVDQLLFSKKQSDLDFLVKNINEEGKKAAGQRILQRVLEKSTRGGQDLNPNFFQKELFNLKPQINRFFTPDERKGIVALRDVLKQTKRAQDASALPPTGVNLIGMLNVMDPRTLGPGLIQAVIERPTIRNLLIKRNAAKTAKQRFNIDAQIEAEMNRLGLLGAAQTGAAIGSLEQTTEGQL